MDVAKILVVDDEENIQDICRIYLEQNGYIVKTVSNGLEALQYAHQWKPALIVLDLILPQVDGFHVCKTLREENNQVPILMLTARDDDMDKIQGLELGADDYLTKPFNPRELVARVKAVLRRQEGQTLVEQGMRKVGDLTIDLDQREVYIASEKISLRTQEFELLKILAEKPGWAFTREQLLSLAWGFDFYGQTRTVDMHIAQLRRKIQKSKVKIETVIGIGYKLVI